MRQYGRLVRDWVTSIGLEPSAYGTHSLRRTKAAEIYRKTGNLRAVQLLLGHTKVDSTVRYLGVELEDALSVGGRHSPFADLEQTYDVAAAKPKSEPKGTHSAACTNSCEALKADVGQGKNAQIDECP